MSTHVHPVYHSTTSMPYVAADEGTEDPDDARFQLPALWTTLSRRWLLIAALTVLGAVLALVVSKLSARTYTSIATVEINKQSEAPLGINSLTGLPQQFSSGDEMAAIMLTEQEELQSSSVAFKVIDQLGLATAAPYAPVRKSGSSQAQDSTADVQEAERERMLGIFQSHLKVSLVKDTKLMQISFTDNNPKRAAAVANAIISTYVNQYAQERNIAATHASSWLTNHLADLRSQVLASENAVTAYQARTGIVGNPDQASTVAGSTASMQDAGNAVVERFIDLNRDLTNAQINRVAKQSVYETLSSANGDAIMAEATAHATGQVSANLTSPGASYATAHATASGADAPELNELSNLRQQREVLELQIASKQDLYADKSPVMVQLHAAIQQIDRDIQITLNRIRTRARDEYILAKANEDKLRDLVAQQKGQVTALTVGSNQLALLQQEAKSKRTMYQDLSSKLEQTSVSSGANESNVTMIDPARPNVIPTSPKTGRNMATGGFTGLVLGVFLAFVLAYHKGYESMRVPRAAFSMLFLLLMLGGAGSLHAQSFPQIPGNLDQVSPVGRRNSVPAGTALQSIPEGFSSVPLQPGYLLEMTIFGAPEMDATLRVDSGGNITVPLVGSLHVAGNTVADAQNEIAQAFQKGEILKSPQVTLNVMQYSASTVTVLGEVQTPGRVEMLGPKSLEQMLALVGGETTSAGSIIEIQRPGVAPIHIRYTQGNNSEALRRFMLQNGDSVYIKRAGVIYVLGAVNRPGGYLMVNRGELNVLQAIALASGMTILAKEGSVYIVRTMEDGSVRQIEVPFNQMSRGKEPATNLQVDDILYIPTSLTKTILINGSGLIGSAAQAVIYRVP